MADPICSRGESVVVDRRVAIVDLVHYCSVPENNAIVQKAKGVSKWNVVARKDVESYIEEDDVILIVLDGLTDETQALTNQLLVNIHRNSG